MAVDLQLTPMQAKAMLEAKALSASALEMFRPTEHQEGFFRTLEEDMILEVLLSGGNRSGKSVSMACAIAAMIMNKPIEFRDGSLHHMRPERWRQEAMKIWIFGYDWKHIGKTMYRLLFQKDLFRIIRDQKTGKFRAWDPSRPGEGLQHALTRPAPPLLRMRDLVGGDSGISWENKKENQISRCEMAHDETQIQFFPSTGAIPQGDPAHVVWIDEAMEDEKLYDEILMRLIDYRGRVLWTAYPTSAPSAKMAALVERSQEQDGKKNRKTYSFTLAGNANPYTSSDHRDAAMDTLDEDEREARDSGRIGLERWQMYPMFSKFVHRVMGRDSVADDALAKVVRGANGIPGDWTRYLVLDPGSANPAVLMVAIPPPNLGDFIVPYDELYMHNTWARPLAQAIAAKTKGTFFEDFIIDAHAALQTPMGFDGRVGENYEKEFAAANLRCRRRGHRFSFGSDNIKGRILRLQGAMNLRSEGGTPRLRLHGCPKLTEQLERYKKMKDVDGNPTDEPAKRQKNDVAVCLEYFVSRDDCGYFRPPVVTPVDGKSPEEVRKVFGSFFGNRSTVSDKTIYCGAGPRP